VTPDEPGRPTEPAEPGGRAEPGGPAEPGGMGDLGDLFSQLEAASADLAAQSEEIEATVVEGHAAGGAVVVRLTGGFEAESVRIDASVVDLDDLGLLEDAVLAAFRDALDQVVDLRRAAVEHAAPQLGGGIDLAALVGNLDLEGMLGGVDLESMLGGTDLDLKQLMGGLGLGPSPAGTGPPGIGPAAHPAAHPATDAHDADDADDEHDRDG
jgi:DNA-binding YbaB/EbfC family protein